MKKILITIIALFTFFISDGQYTKLEKVSTSDYIYVRDAQDTKLEQISADYYIYTENTINDMIHQKGFYKKINGKLKRDGNWKLYINGELKSEGIYSDDKLKLLIVDGTKYSNKDLRMSSL
jgi:uncharacterized ion transporter superfamily protein YfcC